MSRDRLTRAGVLRNGIPIWFGPIPGSGRFSLYLERDGEMEFYGICPCRPALVRILHGFGIELPAEAPEP